MKHAVIVVLAIALMPVYVYAIDGVTLVNQSTVLSAGGFPYVISQPGSYKLSGNLVAPAGMDGIHITVSNVTIDLNGFTISSLGIGSLVFGPTGILVPFPSKVTNIAIRNGAMTDWPSAINVTASIGLGSLEDMTIEENFTTSDGVTVTDGQAVFSTMTLRIKGIVTDGTIQVSCPSVIVESAGLTLIRTGTASLCVVSSSSF